MLSYAGVWKNMDKNVLWCFVIPNYCGWLAPFFLHRDLFNPSFWTTDEILVGLFMPLIGAPIAVFMTSWFAMHWVEKYVRYRRADKYKILVFILSLAGPILIIAAGGFFAGYGDGCSYEVGYSRSGLDCR